MEWEQRAQNAKAYEDEWEEHLLYANGDGMKRSYLHHVHCVGATKLAIEEIYTKDADDQKCRATHQHQRELHG